MRGGLRPDHRRPGLGARAPRPPCAARARPGLTDYGSYENILECVSGYEHGVAAFNALNVQGMRFLHELTGDVEMARAADALAGEVLDLYAGGPFACRQPDDARRVVRTILDFVYVGRPHRP